MSFYVCSEDEQPGIIVSISDKTHFALDDEFNKNIHLSSSTITSLIFGYKFNKAVFFLPSCIEYLTFGHDFNQINYYIPERLKTLTYGYEFNKPIYAGQLPLSICSITFGHKFNQSIDTLPPNLISLTFGCSFDQHVNNFPHYLITLIFKYKIKLKYIVSFNKKQMPLSNLYLFNSKKALTISDQMTRKNENISFSKKIIKYDTLYQKEHYLFWKVQKIPYGCRYTEIICI